jgi:hypothetical protein
MASSLIRDSASSVAHRPGGQRISLGPWESWADCSWTTDAMSYLACAADCSSEQEPITSLPDG